MGGFGITYEATDTVKNCRCAVKEYVPRDLSMRTENRMTLVPTSNSKKELYQHGMKRFLEEAQTLEKLNYVESVVSVYDSFYENGTCYFVMEYVDGCTLNKLIKSQHGRLGYKYIAEIFCDVGTALMQVHSLNIFHRDISPDNIMLNSRGQVKLIDFGNAKNIVRKDDNTLSVILKPGFAPPEQYSSKSVQGTFTDVYALASTMYYTITGKRVPDAVERYKNGGIWRVEIEGYPDYLSAALDKALKLNYKERTQTVETFLKEMHLLQYTENLSDRSGTKEVSQESKGLDKYRAEIKKINNIPGRSVPPIDNQRPSLQMSSIPVFNEYLIQNSPMYKNQKKLVQKPYMYILSGDNVGRTIMLPVNSGVIVGRAGNLAQIVFTQDRYISKQHCEIYYDSLNKSFYIRDLSTNGTWVNGARLIKQQVSIVPNGSNVVLANKICSFKVGVMYE